MPTIGIDEEGRTVRATGKYFVASFLAMLLATMWWLMAVSFVLLGFLLLDAPNLAEAPSSAALRLPVTFALEASHVAAPLLDVAGAEVRAQGALRMPVVTKPGILAAGLAFAMAMLAIVWYGTSQLRAVLVSVRDHRPFSTDNAVRIRRVAYTVIACGLLRAGGALAANSYVAKYFVAEGVRFVSTVGAAVAPSVPMLVCGLIILVLAEVFRAGTRLEEDQTLTI
jgi:hypothetical protein